MRDRIKNIGPWFHNIEIFEGVFTREINPMQGPQPINHPLSRWEGLKPHIPTDMSGLNILDVGSADGFFSVEFAKRGAHVLAVDSWKAMLDRVDFLAETMELDIKTRMMQGEYLELEGSLDIIFNLGLLYHSQHPLLLLENLSKIDCNTMYLESTITQGKGSFMYFKPPQEGVHDIPKWFPTENCVKDMLNFVGYEKIEVFNYETPDRIFLKAEKI